MPDMDEPVNVDMKPEDALRVLLGEERREQDEDSDEDTEDTEDTEADDESS